MPGTTANQSWGRSGAGFQAWRRRQAAALRLQPCSHARQPTACCTRPEIALQGCRPWAAMSIQSMKSRERRSRAHRARAGCTAAQARRSGGGGPWCGRRTGLLETFPGSPAAAVHRLQSESEVWLHVHGPQELGQQALVEHLLHRHLVALAPAGVAEARCGEPIKKVAAGRERGAGSGAGRGRTPVSGGPLASLAWLGITAQGEGAGGRARWGPQPTGLLHAIQADQLQWNPV